jgi:hypothetical protein
MASMPFVYPTQLTQPSVPTQASAHIPAADDDDEEEGDTELQGGEAGEAEDESEGEDEDDSENCQSPPPPPSPTSKTPERVSTRIQVREWLEVSVAAGMMCVFVCVFCLRFSVLDDVKQVGF